MGSENINSKDFGYSGLPGDLQLTRQPSVYSLTFDEFQSTIGGSVKDLGSMNMDELLKSIWTEENKFVASTSVDARQNPGGNLPRQGSLTLPRTLSQKTVDVVWKDISKEFLLQGKIAGEFGVATVIPHRQQTLGEVTLEEFLVRAGVAREDAIFGGKLDDGNFLDDLACVDGSTGLGVPQLEQSVNMMGIQNLDADNNLIAIQPSNMPQTLNGVRPNQPQQLPLARPLPHILPKNPAKPPFNSWVNGQGIGMVGLGAAPIPGSSDLLANPLPSDGMARPNRDSSSMSPLPYAFKSGLRGKRCSASVEKIVERRQRRMIKNRESAARSRARKQAYTTELEAEVAKLKEQNQELRKRQAEIVEKQKNQVVEMMNVQSGFKRRCLRRTWTGAW